MEAGVRARGRGRSWLRWGTGALLALVLSGGVLVAEASAWRDGLVSEQRALPGTVVAGTDVGLAAADELRAAAAAAADEALDRPVTLVHGDERWQVVPRELGAAADIDAVVDGALAATVSTPAVRVAAARWLGHGIDFERHVRLRMPEEALAGFARELADRLDRAPVDARVAWRDGQARLREATPGARLDRAAAARAVAAAIEEAAEVVELPVSPVAPAVPTGALADQLPAVQEAADAALDRRVTVRDGDREWQVSARELGGVPDLGPAVAGDMAGGVPVRVPLSALDDVVASLAGETARSPRDAGVDASSGWVEVVPDEPGVAVDRAAARERLREAFGGGEATVDLPVVGVQAEVTAEDYHHVLLVRQDERRLYLYVDGEIAREWPVAIGGGGSATPTGVFEIGAKRHLPTWHNPAPEGWGADMPEVVEPGPTNPLGLRALNWDRDGRDTLIRFHGTADSSSIGRAASRGCVRLTNGDVVELYDLVEPGTTIVSTWG